MLANRVRKNLAELSKPEKQRLIAALNWAKQSGTYKGPKITKKPGFDSAYFAATSFHGYPNLCAGDGCCIHGYSTFLPWHRLFVRQLEDSLRGNKKYRDVTMPYWDWTQPLEKLPPLIRKVRMKKQPNPFFDSTLRIPGKGKKRTMRNSTALIRYANGCDVMNQEECQTLPQSVFMDQTLLALEETEYECFEILVENPHNMFHNYVGVIPKKDKTVDDCLLYQNDTYCYPYTMLESEYASFDPIFLIFHTMVDRQWAIFQALQEHRGNLPEDDCFPGFEAELQPFPNKKINNNQVTRAASSGSKTQDYKTNLGYQYDNLMFNGMEISALNDFLRTRNDEDRFFAGFSLPDIHIRKIEYKICDPNDPNDCLTIPTPIAKVHRNKRHHPDIFRNPGLLFVEATKYLPLKSWTADKNLRFEIVSSSIPDHITFNPVSIFRQGGSNKDVITIHWPGPYAHYIKLGQSRAASVRFLKKDGTMSVIQYKNRDALFNCNADEQEIKTEEIQLDEKKEYFFQDPEKKCTQENRILIDRTNTCEWGRFEIDESGNARIGWQIDMSKYKDGICMEPGKKLTLYWNRGSHAIREVDETLFEKCGDGTFTDYHGANPGPSQADAPLRFGYGGFSLSESPYHIICWPSHCAQGMKLKINVEEDCGYNCQEYPCFPDLYQN